MPPRAAGRGLQGTAGRAGPVGGWAGWPCLWYPAPYATAFMFSRGWRHLWRKPNTTSLFCLYFLVFLQTLHILMFICVLSLLRRWCCKEPVTEVREQNGNLSPSRNEVPGFSSSKGTTYLCLNKPWPWVTHCTVVLKPSTWHQTQWKLLHHIYQFYKRFTENYS